MERQVPSRIGDGTFSYVPYQYSVMIFAGERAIASDKERKCQHGVVVELTRIVSGLFGDGIEMILPEILMVKGVSIAWWAALLGLVLAIVLILKELNAIYALLLGAIVGCLVGGASLTQTVSVVVAGGQSVMGTIVRVLAAGIVWSGGGRIAGHGIAQAWRGTYCCRGGHRRHRRCPSAADRPRSGCPGRRRGTAADQSGWQSAAQRRSYEIRDRAGFLQGVHDGKTGR